MNHTVANETINQTGQSITANQGFLYSIPFIGPWLHVAAEYTQKFLGPGAFEYIFLAFTLLVLYLLVMRLLKK